MAYVWSKSCSDKTESLHLSNPSPFQNKKKIKETRQHLADNTNATTAL